jgi:hypothetical protein
MPEPNIQTPEWEAELPPPFSSRGLRVGAAMEAAGEHER